MSYTYPYISDAMANGLLSGIFSGVPTTLIGIATYVLSALGLYTIAKRRGLNHPWLAWIPVASAWIVGSLSDQYRYVVNGEELDSYRRAQQVERSARERAELVYHQANGVLNEAIAKVDTATAEITAKTDEAMSQLTQLQMAVSTSKQALQDAASLMNTIRPNY